MSDKNKPIILVTNDDGIHAPGIRALIEAVKPLGQVVVVAPDKPQSGMGHAITLNDPLRLKKWIFSEILKPIPAVELLLIVLNLLRIKFCIKTGALCFRN